MTWAWLWGLFAGKPGSYRIAAFMPLELDSNL